MSNYRFLLWSESYIGVKSWLELYICLVIFQFFDKALISTSKWIIYWNKILLIRQFIYDEIGHSMMEHFLWFEVTYIYINRTLVRNINFSRDCLLYHKVLISVLKSVISLNRTIIKTIHSLSDFLLYDKSVIIDWNESSN
jgi:hypothetical protein